jgi:hypothetical protein
VVYLAYAIQRRLRAAVEQVLGLFLESVLVPLKPDCIYTPLPVRYAIYTVCVLQGGVYISNLAVSSGSFSIVTLTFASPGSLYLLCRPDFSQLLRKCPPLPVRCALCIQRVTYREGCLYRIYIRYRERDTPPCVYIYKYLLCSSDAQCALNSLSDRSLSSVTVARSDCSLVCAWRVLST